MAIGWRSSVHQHLGLVEAEGARRTRLFLDLRRLGSVHAAAEPPELPDVETTGDEGTTLVSMLDFYRAVLVRKAWGLTRY